MDYHATNYADHTFRFYCDYDYADWICCCPPGVLATPEVNYTDASQLKHSDWDTCLNKHYMHVAEWTYCLNGNVKGAVDSGEWRWNDEEKTLTFDNFVLKRQNFTGSYEAGTFVEVVFDRSTVEMNELTVKYRGKNVSNNNHEGIPMPSL